MTKEQKQEVIDVLKDKFSQYSNFYVTDTENLSVDQITAIRHTCFDKQVEMKVAKNTLIRKALESLDNEKYSGVYEALHNVTALMFSETPKDPAVIISSFRRDSNQERPALKAAFINGDLYLGDDKLTALTRIKSKEELVAEVISLLMSPIQRVIGALQNKQEGEVTKAEKPEAPVAEAIAPAKEKKAEAPEAKAEKPVEKSAPSGEEKKDEGNISKE